MSNWVVVSEASWKDVERVPTGTCLVPTAETRESLASTLTVR